MESEKNQNENLEKGEEQEGIKTHPEETRKNNNSETHPHGKDDHTKECKECKKLRDEIHHLKREVEELKKGNVELDDSYKRKVAEFDNYRKRMLKQMDDNTRDATRKVVSEILPILDNFGRALRNSEVNHEFDVLFGGLKITNDQIIALFEKLGIKAIDSIGCEFDPNLHEALMMEERDDVEFEKTVTEEFEKGYLIGDSIIRHAKVKVAKKISK